MKKENLIFFGIIAAVSAAAIIALITYNINNGKDNIVINVGSTVSDTEISYEENSVFSDENSQKSEKTKKSSKNKKSSSKKSTKKTRSSKKSVKSVKKTQKTVDETEVSFPINLNSASAEELCAIKGIGETLAGNIISYRDSIGGFINRDQLLDVDGIGEAKYASIREYLYIENEQELPQDISDSENEENQTKQENYSDETEIYSDDDNLPDSEDIICIELNSAELEDLEMIPCFDEEMCESILELRDKIGHFSDVYEILYADGMTKKLFCEAEKYLYVENEDTE